MDNISVTSYTGFMPMVLLLLAILFASLIFALILRKRGKLIFIPLAIFLLLSIYTFITIVSIKKTSSEIDDLISDENITNLYEASRNRAKFEITNKTDDTIDCLNIKTYNNSPNPFYLKLEPGQSQVYWLDMNNIPQVDGDYLLTYKDSTTKSMRFGYFTNGYALEKVTKIVIISDTILIDQIFDDY